MNHYFHRGSSPLSLVSLFQATANETQSTLTDMQQSTSPIRFLSNEELAQRRIDARREKRDRRYRNLKERAERNLEVKRMLNVDRSTIFDDSAGVVVDDDRNDCSTSQTISIPALYAVKVWVDEELRRDLKLTGRERRGRVFIDAQSDAVSTIKALKYELHNFFRALRKDTYLLSAALPRVSSEDGSLLSPVDTDAALNDSWMIETDDDVIKTFMTADSFFVNSTTSDSLPTLKRPSIQINVLKNPDYKPPPTPSYLIGMPDPKESDSMTMLSFYAFPPSPGIVDPERFAADLKRKWRPFEAVGRVYVAQEGINAQMAVATNVLKNFMDCANTVPELQWMENGMNIDPKPLSREEFAVAGVPVNGKPSPPFRNLHIRVRRQVVADGLEKSLDWSSAGYDMPALEWHERLKKAAETKSKNSGGDRPSQANDDIPIVLDCRNTYETEVGIFDGAEPLGTQNFRDSWDVLKERLADTPKDAPIMTYCTGKTKRCRRSFWQCI
jgi:predicted sulfurtransferase